MTISQLEEDDDMGQEKAFEIPKVLVWKSYLDVRKNRGAAGCDGQSLIQFDEKRNKNLYKIWNRLSSGSYFPPPVLEKRIPKGDSKERVLGIPTVADRVAQGAVKLYVEERLDPLFHENSYGYRPGKSAHQALEACKQRCWKHSWVLEVDISAFFDNVRHDLVIKALEHHQMPRWVILYCKRWLEAPMQPEAEREALLKRTVGTPQGGVISPLLANLFLHYAFDQWMERNFKQLPFERYADDIVVHCNTLRETAQMRRLLKERFRQVGLSVNERKSKIVYIDIFKRYSVETCFTFLGYDFKLRTLRDSKGELFRKCMPGASKKAMRNITMTIKEWRIHRSTADNAEEIARRHNSVLRGWINYYGKFWYRNFSYHLWRVFQSRLLKWMKSRYRISSKKAEEKLALLRKNRPQLFVHWYLLRASNV